MTHLARQVGAGLFALLTWATWLPVSADEGFGIYASPLYIIPKSKTIDPPPGGGQVKLFDVPTNEAPAILRFSVEVESATAREWVIRIDAAGQLTEISNANLPKAFVYSNIIEVPSPDAGGVSAEFSAGAPNIKYVAAVKLPTNTQPLFTNGSINLERLESDFPVPPAANVLPRSIGKSVVKISYRSDLMSENSTGFQFAPGYFLTTLHSISERDGSLLEQGSITVQFGSYERGLSSSEYSVVGKVVAHGIPEPSKVKWPLDYAIIRAEVGAPYRNWWTKLSDRVEMPDVNSLLEVYTIWYAAVPANGKFVSRDDQCRVVDKFESDSDSSTRCRAMNFKHACDVDSGSSGSPVLLRGANAAIAMHYAGIKINKGNCALSVAAILDDVQKRFPEIWSAIKESISE